MDMHVHDTYFVIAHFHFIMVGGMVMAYMGGLHYWWPKMTGRMYSRMVVAAGGAHHLRRLLPDVPAAVRASATTACRAAITRYAAGVPGLERAVDRPAPRSWRSATCCRLCYLLYSLRYGQPAGPNPVAARPAWNGKRPRRRRSDNFDETPIVVRGPYEYHLEKAQNEP